MVEQIDDLHDERIKQLDKQLLDIEYDIELQRDIIEKQVTMKILFKML